MALPVTIGLVGDIIEAQPLIASASAITSAQIALHAGQAEATIWAKCAKLYAVPIAPTPPIIETIWTDLTVYGVLVKQAILANTLEESPWPDRYKETMDLLTEIAEGEMPIVTASGTLIPQVSGTAAPYRCAFKSDRGYQPTFTELPDEYQGQDPNKTEDLLRERR